MAEGSEPGPCGWVDGHMRAEVEIRSSFSLEAVDEVNVVQGSNLRPTRKRAEVRVHVGPRNREVVMRAFESVELSSKPTPAATSSLRVLRVQIDHVS